MNFTVSDLFIDSGDDFDLYDLDQFSSSSYQVNHQERARERERRGGGETGMYGARAVERVIAFLPRVFGRHHRFGSSPRLVPKDLWNFKDII